MIQARLKVFVRLGVCSAALLAQMQGQTPRLRVAVYPFDQSTVQANIQKEVGGNVNYGQVASELLIGELASQVDVISRDQMERILKEQGRRYDERFDPSQAPEFGKLLGVDAIVTGSITALHADQHASGLNNIGIPKGPKLNRGNSTVNVQVEVAAQMISTVTGKILSAPHGAGTVKEKTSGTLQVAGQGTTDASTSKSGYDQYVREALLVAVKDIGGQFASTDANAPRNPAAGVVAASGTQPKSPEPKGDEYTALPDEVGNVFKVDADSMAFFVAPGAKIVPGDVLEVQHVEMTKNPRTGKMTAFGQTLGTLKVTEVSSDTGKGKYQGKPATDQDRLIKTAAASAQGQDHASRKQSPAKP